MSDRAFLFQNSAVRNFLRHEFIPVAIDAWYQQRSKEPGARLFMKICKQLPGIDPDGTIQGLYIVEPSGKLVYGWNGRDTNGLRRELSSALKKIRSGDADPRSAVPEFAQRRDRYARPVPEGAAVVDVFARVTRGTWKREGNRFEKVRRKAVGRDRMWIQANEIEALRKGEVPIPLARRIVRYHLIDNTRGEPPMWKSQEVRAAQLEATAAGPGKWKLTGRGEVRTGDGTRGYKAALLAHVEFAGGKLTRFDFVARGTYNGHGPFTRDAPDGDFEVSVVMRLADPKDRAYAVPPQGARELRQYFAAR